MQASFSDIAGPCTSLPRTGPRPAPPAAATHGRGGRAAGCSCEGCAAPAGRGDPDSRLLPGSCLHGEAQPPPH